MTNTNIDLIVLIAEKQNEFKHIRKLSRLNKNILSVQTEN